MMDNSFSISFGDSILTPTERKTVREITNKYYDEAYELIKMAHFGTFATELDDSLKYLKTIFYNDTNYGVSGKYSRLTNYDILLCFF